MFERIMSIDNNSAKVKISNNFNVDILNYHVVFEDSEKKILGIVNEINNNDAIISFLGEFKNIKFYEGIIRKPTVFSSIRIINQQELNELINNKDNKTILIGNSPLYNNIPISVNIADFFGNHTLILGNNGSGKTYGITKIIQNFFSMKDKLPFNSNIFIFSSNYEYERALKNINNINSNFNYKMYTISDKNGDKNQIQIPLCLLDVDDFVNLLNVSSHGQIDVIKKMLNYVSILYQQDDKNEKYKNHLIAKALHDVIYSNQINTRIREQVFNILSLCNTKELNLDVKVPGIGYTKEFRKCFEIDKNGEFEERTLVFKYIQNFIDNNIKLNTEFKPTNFTLEQLENTLDFVLISNCFLFNDKYYNDVMAVKDKLNSFRNSSYNNIFDINNFMNCEQFINSILIENKSRAQIINYVLDDMDINFSKCLVKIMSRMLYKFNKNKNSNERMPFYLIIEEAHKYIQDDIDIDLLGYNIFERIAHDGRKYGVIMNLITHQPGNLSKRVLSGVTNFIIFRLNDDSDFEYLIKNNNILSLEIMHKSKSLQTGTCIALGNIFKIPMIIKMELPNPEPNDDLNNMYDKWIVNF